MSNVPIKLGLRPRCSMFSWTTESLRRDGSRIITEGFRTIWATESRKNPKTGNVDENEIDSTFDNRRMNAILNGFFIFNCGDYDIFT